MTLFHYKNVEAKHHRGTKTVRKVHIRGNIGHKSITKYVGGVRRHSIRHKLNPEEIAQIKVGKFIPGLFRDCKICSKTAKASRKLAKRTITIL